MDTEESNFRFFLKKRITIYPNLYKMKTVKSLLKKKQLFSQTIVSETKHKQFKTKLTI